MFNELEARLGHTFQQSELLRVALTHRSYHFEHKAKSIGHFERLEFLGDAVLDLILSEALMIRFPEMEEGTLSKWRASLVNENTLGEVASELELGPHVFLGRSEELKRQHLRPRMLASVLEAVLGALYLDGGLETARALVLKAFQSRLEQLNSENQFSNDFKTRLQEWTQKRLRQVPEYRMVASEGPEHAKKFTYEVLVLEKKMGEGFGPSRKAAEQNAASNALIKISEQVGD